MSWNLLERFLESEHFNKDPSLTVAYLAYEEIEFFLPQLCHLLISIDNESMALEEFIIDLCEESVNGALLTFWLLQTYLHDLASQPGSNAFQTCRRNYNKVQRIVFGGGEPARPQSIHENVLPVTVLGSIVLASIGMPILPQHAGPLAIGQARRPRPVEDMISEAMPQAPKLGRSNTVSGSPTSSRKARSGLNEPNDTSPRKLRKSIAVDADDLASSLNSGSPRPGVRKVPSHRQSLLVTKSRDGFASTASLPDQRKSSSNMSPTLINNSSMPGVPRRPSEANRRHSQALRPVTPATMTRSQKIRALRQNYFRSEMQFLTALEGISARLVAVPKPARLSALRAELALIAQDLPAEVDIPLICPATLVEGSASRSKHHRIVRLNPAEATSLNSAQKVPYLLMLEILREDFDFDPDNAQNIHLLATIGPDKARPKRRLFDISDAARQNSIQSSSGEAQADSVLEPANGDLSSATLLQDLAEDIKSKNGSPVTRALHEPPRLSSGISTLSNASIPTPRNSEGPFGRESGSGGRPSPFLRPQNPNQSDVSALADHMRTASQMLAQLELSTSKRPKTEVAAIKAKIIASMQSLEEQSFLNEDALSTPSFDTIMAKAGAAAAETDGNDLENDEMDAPTDPSLNTGKGAARMENDAMTGGIQRKGDRDDPSAATFGEAWEEKKERIRKSSPYGWARNWDLVSVIVKTGDDLRQEAFACQVIAVCSKIWAEHDVDVWVKQMRILVTGESSGLIETITNAVSMHSIKRSLTLASMAASTNPKKRIATLQDHWTKTFGAADSPAYLKAIDCFIKSLAAYSTISYVLQLKDRHNGNILIDSDGHVVHIDFGFMLSNSPGNMGFEAAPFKLTLEYVELLGGVDGAAFARFKELVKAAFQALRRDAERIVTLVELMGLQSAMPCYGGGLPSVVAALRARFVLEKSREEARDWVDDLVAKSVGSYYTRLYDTFQYRTQGIY
nr:phosphatidylinositol 4-kinase pik1a [Quercus suber]